MIIKSQTNLLSLLIVIFFIALLYVFTMNNTEPKSNTQQLQSTQSNTGDIYPVLKYSSMITFAPSLFKDKFLSSCFVPTSVASEFGYENNVTQVLQDINPTGNSNQCPTSLWMITPDPYTPGKTSMEVKTIAKNLNSFWELKKWDPKSNKIIDSNDRVLYGDTFKIRFRGEACQSGLSFITYISGERGGCHKVIRDRYSTDYFTIKSPTGKLDGTNVNLIGDDIVLLRNNGDRSLVGGIPVEIDYGNPPTTIRSKKGNYDVKTLETNLKDKSTWWKVYAA